MLLSCCVFEVLRPHSLRVPDSLPAGAVSVIFSLIANLNLIDPYNDLLLRELILLVELHIDVFGVHPQIRCNVTNLIKVLILLFNECLMSLFLHFFLSSSNIIL